MVLTGRQDAFGALMEAAHEGQSRAIGVIERDDGYIEPDIGSNYLAPIRQWDAIERAGIRRAHGRVLDAGCGAGRVALHLQQRGLEVVGIDISAGAVEVSKARGVRQTRAMAIQQVSASIGPFDTVAMYGANLGLLRDARHARWLLRRLHHVTTPGATILGSSRDPFNTEVAEHFAYHERNRRRGRMPGQIRLRFRYRERTSPWFDYLFLSIDELSEIAAGSGWRLDDVVAQDDGPMYVAVMRKT